MESIEQLARKLKGDVGKWEGVVYHWACGLACEVTKRLLEQVDEELAEQRDQGLKVEGMREHTVITAYGDVRIKRRLYRGEEGESRFLLDEQMGLDKRCHVSPKVKELATHVASYFPFQKSEEVLRALLPSGISHTTIHRLVARVTDPYLAAEEQEIREVYEGGVIPETQGRIVPHLFVEGDGTIIALQREKRRRAELKVGIAYEGWEKTRKDRYCLKAKTTYSGIMDGDRFWEGFSLVLAKKYDLARVGKVIVGGDGAPWVKDGAELLSGIYQLDRFHLARAIRQTVDNGLDREVYRACLRGEITEADRLLMAIHGQSGEDKAEEIARLRGYLLENAHGLRDYRLEIGGDGSLRSMGAMEANIDKLVANRMKKRGMSWRIKRAGRMAKLLSLRQTGQLVSWILHRVGSSQAPIITTGRKKDTGAWLRTKLPALYESPDRPWTSILRDLTNGARPGLSPTSS